MKKLVSLILALVLSLGCMLPAMAETTEVVEAPAVFAFGLTDFQTYFDLFITSTGLGITPVWTTSEDGLTAEGDAQDLGKVFVTLNTDGLVTKVALEFNIPLDNLELGAYYYGVTLAMTTMAVKLAEDPDYLNDTTVATQLEADLTTLVTALTNRISEALAGTIYETGTIGGHIATVSTAFNAIDLTLFMGYTYEP